MNVCYADCVTVTAGCSMDGREIVGSYDVLILSSFNGVGGDMKCVRLLTVTL